MSNQCWKDLEELERDASAMDRVREIFDRFDIEPGIKFDSIRREVSGNLEAARDKARWVGIKSELDDLERRLSGNLVPDSFTFLTPVVHALVLYVRHLEVLAGVVKRI